MSRKYGPIKQNGYVVRDIVAAMKHWSEALGVGPWFYLGEVDDLRADYKGMPTDAEHQSEGGTIAYGGMTSGTRFAYFDASYDLGTMIEIAVLSDVSESFMDHIRTTAEDWDGTNPIRPVGNGKNEKTQLRN